jgi:hypothetical protein
METFVKELFLKFTEILTRIMNPELKEKFLIMWKKYFGNAELPIITPKETEALNWQRNQKVEAVSYASWQKSEKGLHWFLMLKE